MNGPSTRARAVPSATYRLQFNREFSFPSALRIADYLGELGISHVYASPLFQATPHSTHGYDICSFNQLNPNLGSSSDLDLLVARLRSLNMGVLLDMVPNHMGADLSNAWWADVLAQGSDSAYAPWFDIDWEPPDSALRGKVLLPVLEDEYWKVLEAGKLSVIFEGGWYAVKFHQREYPVSPESGATLFSSLLDPGLEEPCFRGIRAMLSLVTAPEAGEAVGFGSRFAEAKEGLDALVCGSPELRARLQKQLQHLNGTPGQFGSFDALHRLLQEQHYRLAFWRVGAEEINYRRFFDIADLVSVRMELPQVYLATHQLVSRLVSARKIDGLRIDHPDGLWNPKQYFERLQESSCGAGESQTPLYVVVEKILTREEPLPPDWPVDGTTGYDFLNVLNGLFVDGANRSEFDAIYQKFTGCSQTFKSVMEHSKRQVLLTSFLSELTALTRSLKSLAALSRYGQDFTFSQLHSALLEIATAFPVYRTYVTESSEELPPDQEAYVREAVRAAAAANGNVDPAVYGFIKDILLLSFPSDVAEADRPRYRRCVMKFQQLTSPAMAKGLEDTAFYRFNRLISLNEVGGDPDTFGTSASAFHTHNAAKAKLWPRALLATATHDTKRGEDARARINVLSEMPQEWRHAVSRWKHLNQEKKVLVDGQLLPDSNDEYLLYQTLVGAWPAQADNVEALEIFRHRIAAYMLKAIREAKTHTSWTKPIDAYENATALFVQRLLAAGQGDAFLSDFKAFQKRAAFFGRLNSLSQTLLKIFSPGVPDFYQGTELWDYSLVDPDNRRLVDFDSRRLLLDDLRRLLKADPLDLPVLLKHLLRDSDTGQVKLYLIWRALRFRLGHRETFDQGEYLPLAVAGSKSQHVVAFARTHGEHTVLVIAPRLAFGLTGGQERLPLGVEVWGDTAVQLPGSVHARRYRNVLTEEVLCGTGLTDRLPVGQVLARFPVALLESLS